MNREKYIQFIQKKLNLLTFEISQNNLLNLTDKNIYSENFFANLLNAMFDYQLKNANILSSTTDTIDLVCSKEKLAVQVTSNDTTVKINETVKKFKSNNHDKKYDKLKIVVMTTKKYRKKFSQTTYFNPDEDILTTNTILRYISTIINIDKLKELYEIIRSELCVEEPSNYVVLNEVETILNIISYISGKEDYNLEDSIEPDPENKINNRFKEFASEIKHELIEYAKLYKSLYEEIYSNLSTSEIAKVSLYLRRESIKRLKETNNPIDAIENMVLDIKNEFANKHIHIDEGAVYYFLYKHVIICNVFPNEDGE